MFNLINIIMINIDSDPVLKECYTCDNTCLTCSGPSASQCVTCS